MTTSCRDYNYDKGYPRIRFDTRLKSPQHEEDRQSEGFRQLRQLPLSLSAIRLIYPIARRFHLMFLPTGDGMRRPVYDRSL